MSQERHDRNTAVLGMWIFLGTEALLFSALLLTLLIYRHLHPLAFALGTRHLSLLWGTMNTALLLTSSWTMAMAVRHTEQNESVRASRLLFITAGLGLSFLAIKGYEYLTHFHEHLMPLISWNPEARVDPAFQLFFVLYFVTTALHALHLFIGCGLSVFGAVLVSSKSKRCRVWIENFGLFWHFVDLVWIGLFPLLYLIGRNS